MNSRVLATTLLLVACNFEGGNRVFRGETLGELRPSGTATFAFRARGHETIFTLAGDQEPVVPLTAAVTFDVIDSSGKSVAKSTSRAAELETSEWDEPRASLILSRRVQPSLKVGAMYELHVTVAPVPPHPAIVVHHWIDP